MVLLLVVVAWGCAGMAAETASPLERGFQQPPEQTKPWCYWYWISDNISKEGITRDLEADGAGGHRRGVDRQHFS